MHELLWFRLHIGLAVLGISRCLKSREIKDLRKAIFLHWRYQIQVFTTCLADETTAKTARKMETLSIKVKGGNFHYNAIVKTVQRFGFGGEVTLNAKESSVALVSRLGQFLPKSAKNAKLEKKNLFLPLLGPRRSSLVWSNWSQPQNPVSWIHANTQVWNSTLCSPVGVT